MLNLPLRLFIGSFASESLLSPSMQLLQIGWASERACPPCFQKHTQSCSSILLIGWWTKNAPFRSLWGRGEREFSFPTIPGNTGLPFPFPKIGIDFFIPVPKSWEYYFSFPFPFPKFGNAIFHSRSRYREWLIKVGI